MADLAVGDLSGTPRSDKEIEEAIRAIKEVMIKQPLVLPMVTVHGGIIMDGLKELLLRRQKEKGGE